MNKFRRITALGFGEQGLPAAVGERLEDLAAEVDVVERGESVDGGVSDCLLVPLGGRVDVDLIESFPSLRYVGILGTGFGGIDVAACEAKGIAVCNVAGYSTEAVAELCVAMLLDHHREIHRARRQAEAGDLDESSFTGTDLSSLRMGIVGAGTIGTRLAELMARGFGAEVRYWSRRRRPELEADGVSFLDLNGLARRSDVVSVHLASNETTRSMLGPRFLDTLQQGSTVVATVPLDVFDIPALVERVRDGRFVLLTDHSDALAPEELAVLMSCSGAVVYPSIGYGTAQATANKHRAFVRSIEAFLAGDCYNRVDAGAGR